MPSDAPSPPNTPTDPDNARPKEVRQGAKTPGMLTVLIISVLAIAGIYAAMLAFSSGANEDDQDANERGPSELLDEAPPDISGESAT